MQHKWLGWVGVILLPLVLFAGGKPNPGTPRDKRLKENKPKSAAPKAMPVKKAK